MSFTFKQFHIDDSHCAMKIGTDGVLLGAWTDPVTARVILDAGAGSGLVSLMLAQRTSFRTRIMSVEIDPGAAADCDANFRSSPFADRLSVVTGDCLTVDGPFDLIVSNPPFFNGSLKSPDRGRAKARQGDTLHYASLIRYAARQLTTDGMLAMITDYVPHADIMFEAEMAGLKLRRFCTVRSRRDKAPFRALWQFGRNDGLIERTQLIIRNDDNTYSAQYRALTHDFYLDL